MKRDSAVEHYQKGADVEGYRRHGAPVSLVYKIDPRRQAVDRLAGLHAGTDRQIDGRTRVATGKAASKV